MTKRHFGMTYTGDASQEDEGASTIASHGAGETITVTFGSTTWDDVSTLTRTTPRVLLSEGMSRCTDNVVAS